MSWEVINVIEKEHHWNMSLKPPILGFVFSLVLIVAMYRFVTHHHLSGMSLACTIFGFALFVGLIQLIFFLHLGVESKPHWNTITFLFMVLLLVIVIGGSLWIMNNLDYNLMPSTPSM